MKDALLLSLALIAVGPVAVEGQETRELPGSRARLGSAVAVPSSIAHGWLEVPSAVDVGVSLPVSVIRGATDGPTLGVVAGVHGSEYTPILASGRLAQVIDPSELKGTVLIVHAANPPAFFGRTVYTGPVDGKNLNRVFPGRAQGTLSERIADVLVREVMAHSDFLLDLHSGDANEDLRPYVGYYGQAGSAEVIASSRAMAYAFGTPLLVRFPQSFSDAAIYAGGAGVVLGRPAIDVEVGGRGRAADAEIDLVVNGVLRVLRHLDMIGMNSDAPPARSVVAPVEIVQRSSARSPLDGAFLPAVSPGEWVAEGSTLGTVQSLHGDDARTVLAPASGVVLVLLATPPIREGEWVATIGHLPSG